MTKENIEYSLGFNNIKNIPLEKYEKNFTFIVEGKKYETSRFVADLLSPIIRNCHYVDETINSFTIHKCQSSSNEEDYFSEFLKLSEFNSHNISEIQRDHYMQYFVQLGNFDEYLSLYPELKRDESADNAVDRLIFINQTLMNENIQKQSIPDEIVRNLNITKFISSHFFEISKEKIKLLPVEVIQKIFNDESLKLEDEDSLLNLIIEFYLEDNKYSILFECVNFPNVSEESITRFVQIFRIDDINTSIWNKICERLIHSKPKNSKERYITKYKEFKHDQNNEFHGILRYLTEETNGNIHDNGTIEITSNSIYNSTKNPKNLVNYRNSDCEYYSKNNDGTDHVIVFDFKDKLIQLESYTIQSRDNNPNNVHLKNWVFEVSNNGNSDDWVIVDRRENDSTLNGCSIIHTFEVNQKKDGFYRYVRLRQTGDSWYSCDHKTIGFPFIEFYGKLIGASKK